MDYRHRWIMNREEAVEQFIFQNGSPFQSYSFLQAVGEDYRALVLEDSEMLAVMPLVKTRKYGRKAICAPNYTYQFGPVIKRSIQQPEVYLDFLLDHLPPSGFYDFKLKMQTEERQVFLEKGFDINELKTHWVDKARAYKLSLLSSDKRRDVRKLLKEEKKGNIRILEDREGNIERILDLWKRTGKRSDFDIHHDKVTRILEAGLPHYNNLIEDADGRALSGTFCPYSHHTMYHMIGAGIRVEDSLLSRTHMLALYKAIQHAQSQGLHFDTEGSMIPGVADFYRRMGAEPVSLYRASKAGDLYFRLIQQIQYWRGSKT